MTSRTEIKKAIYGWVREDLLPEDGIALSPDHVDRLADKIAAVPSGSPVERLERLGSAPEPLPSAKLPYDKINFSICAGVQPGLVVLVEDGRVSYAGPIKDMPDDAGKLLPLNKDDFTKVMRALAEGVVSVVKYFARRFRSVPLAHEAGGSSVD